jgi:hypothetical protein
MSHGNIHIGKDVWTWRIHTGVIEIRDPKNKKTLVSFTAFGHEYGDDETRPIVPSEIRRHIEGVILAPPDGIKCLTCYGKDQRAGTKGRFRECVICHGTGRREPNIVPKW